MLADPPGRGRIAPPAGIGRGIDHPDDRLAEAAPGGRLHHIGHPFVDGSGEPAVDRRRRRHLDRTEARHLDRRGDAAPAGAADRWPHVALDIEGRQHHAALGLGLLDVFLRPGGDLGRLQLGGGVRIAFGLHAIECKIELAPPVGAQRPAGMELAGRLAARGGGGQPGAIGGLRQRQGDVAARQRRAGPGGGAQVTFGGMSAHARRNHHRNDAEPPSHAVSRIASVGLDPLHLPCLSRRWIEAKVRQAHASCSAMTTPEVSFEREGRAGFITLNRPDSLNALTLGMIRHIHRILARWADDPAVGQVAIRANGTRAFCAGGDLRALYRPGFAKAAEFAEFYREEYRLNTFIKRYPKPFIALVDGLVMGGGVGVSLHGSHRVAGDRMVFAMPETGIGLFPDVGATYLLSRLPGAIGLYLGLTGARVEARDALWSGIATHFVPSGNFPALTAALASAGDIDRCLGDFTEVPAPGLLAQRRASIDRLFASRTLDDLLTGLANDSDGFAADSLAELRTKSPTSLAITFRQLKGGRSLSFEEAIALEFRIVCRIPLGQDFFEGIRAIVIDKDKAPRWRPATIAEVSPETIERYFAPLAAELNLENLTSTAPR